MTTTPIGADVALRRAGDAALRFAVEVTVDHDYPETTPALPRVLARWRAAAWVHELMNGT